MLRSLLLLPLQPQQQGFQPVAQSIFLGPAAHAQDSARQVEEKLNAYFAERFATLGISASSREIVRLTVSSHDGQIDSVRETQRKINHNLLLIAEAQSSTFASVTLSETFNLVSGFDQAAVQRLNSHLSSQDVSAPYVFVDADAAAHVARMTAVGAEPINTIKQAFDAFVVAVKASGAWAKRSEYLLPCVSPTLAGSLLGIKNLKNATVKTGSPTHFAYRGVFCDGVDDALGLFTPSTDAKFLQNDCNLSACVRSDDQRSTAAIGSGTAAATLWSPHNTSSKFAVRLWSAATTTSTTSVTTAFGWHGANRTGASALTLWRAGVQLDGTFTTASSSASSSVEVEFGRSNSTYVQQQLNAVGWGGSLLDAEVLAEAQAVATLLAACGVTAVGTLATSGVSETISLIGRTVLPDGAAAQLAGRGLPGTGWDSTLADSAGGERWIGWGIGSNSGSAGVCRMTAPNQTTGATTLVGEYSLAGMGSAAGITVPAQSSTQGVFVDKSDGSIWWVAVDVTGGVNYLAHAAAPVGNAAPVLLSCAALPTNTINSLCKDSRGDWWAVDSSAATIRKYVVSELGVPAVATPAVTINTRIAGTDQVSYVASKDLLLVAGGANGVNGLVHAFPLVGDYGAVYLRQRFTMIDWLGIEGVYWTGTNFEGPNDQYTHVEAAFPYNNLSISGPVSLAAA